jgi:hypothetical protein
VTVYKIVEASTVTDEALEQIVNTWVARGWSLDGIQFAMRESSKRPAMAFVLFTRDESSEPGAQPEPQAEDRALG